jgi:ATP synthase subunit 6
MFLFSPFEQFEINNYFFLGLDYFYSDTIIVFYFLIFLIEIFQSFFFSRINYNLFYNPIFIILKSCYTFIYGVLEDYLGNNTKYYFPFFFYLFLFISISNIIGIIPFSFTVTSHLNITFTLAMIVWLGIAGIGFFKHGLEFFNIFFAVGIPFKLVPFLALIELISFIFRSISLALRLFANLVAGHILLDTVAIFIYNLINSNLFSFKLSLLSIIPFLLCIILICFELVVAILQGYIFVILSVIYLKDVYSSH